MKRIKTRLWDSLENGMFNLLMHISINGPEANHVITMAVKTWQTTKERQKVTRSV